uniref:Uncharacterized protein n=1 Tax=Oryza meridionalis TaxID=40149 RepID=A0A0E0DQ81_9ORYZ
MDEGGLNRATFGINSYEANDDGISGGSQRRRTRSATTFGGRSNNIIQLGREAVVEVRSLGGVAAWWLCRHTGAAELVLIEGEGGGWEDGSLRIWLSVAAHGIFGVNMIAGSEQGWFGGGITVMVLELNTIAS